MAATPREAHGEPGKAETAIVVSILCLVCPVLFPADSTVPEKQPIRVFILAGQSNMEGQAVVDLDHPRHYNGGKGTLVKLLENPEHAKSMGHLRQKDGSWTVRDDVWCWYRAGTDARLKNGPLSVGFAVYEGRHHFGPELQFGHVLGDHLDADAEGRGQHPSRQAITRIADCQYTT